jgi:SAM-dependent methyltransferase
VNDSDHFSHQSAEYSLYRPDYPDKLFQYLVDLTSSTDIAWDCATGNGQAATGLARYFKKVIATDISAAQIGNAPVMQNIDYRVASAEQSGIDANCIDLLLVAQALHWFDLDAFYREAFRVLKTGGVLATVCYQLPRINTDINAIIDLFHADIIGDYWPAERRHVDTAYRDIPFPLQEIPSPALHIEHDWTLDQFLGYLRSWSAVVYFEKEHKRNPTELIKMNLSALWGELGSRQAVCWPLTLRIGKFNR